MAHTHSRHVLLAPDQTGSDQDQINVVHYLGQAIPFFIRRSGRSRRLSIRIGRDRVVTVVSPPGVSDSVIRDFAREHASWIHVHTVRSVYTPPPVRTYADGEKYPWFGDEISLRIRTGPSLSVTLAGSELVMILPDALPPSEREAIIRSQIELFFSSSLREVIHPCLLKYASLLEIPPPKISIRNQKTKWGSCTPHRLTFNVRLCMAPLEIIEYVVVHEMCHRKQPNHGPAFWELVHRLLPSFAEQRDYLKKNGYLWTL